MSEQSIEVTRRKPTNFQMTDEYLFSHEWFTIIPSAKMRIYHNPIFSSELIFYKGSIKFNKEATPERLHGGSWRTRLKRLYQRITFKNQRLNGEYVLIIDDWSEGYFHWMTDALPRFIFFKENHDSQVKLLVPKKFEQHEYITSSLLALGADVFYLEDGKFFQVDLLYYPSLTAPSGNYNPFYLRKIRDSILIHFHDFHELSSSPKVYISRKKSAKRKIVNEAEAEYVLREFGYTIYCFEDFSWKQQVAIMRNAKSLISNHGAGLTNMMFMRPLGSVLEFRRKGDTNNNCYFSMASVFDLEYYYQECTSDTDNTFSANLTVDLIELRNNLRRMEA